MARSRRLGWAVAGFLLSAVGALPAAPLPGDAEAATHGDTAAQVELVKETAEKTDDVVFRQYNLAVLSHYSYLIGSGGEALIVDPARDIDRYLQDAQELGLKITRVYLTHSHADFVAGHMELAKAVNAQIIINAATQAGYPHTPVKDGGCHHLRQRPRRHRHHPGAHARRHLSLRLPPGGGGRSCLRADRRHPVHRQRRPAGSDGRRHERCGVGCTGL